MPYWRHIPSVYLSIDSIAFFVQFFEKTIQIVLVKTNFGLISFGGHEI